MIKLEIWLIAISLAMDCFAVSIASGIFLKKVKIHPMLTMAFFFGTFQAVMPLIGFWGGHLFSNLISSIDHWIAFGILAFLGYRMIRESFKEHDDDSKGIDPSGLKTIIILAISTSIDALAVGTSFAFLSRERIPDIFYSILIIGLVSFILTILGFIAGSSSKKARNFPAELAGGVILILIGSKILIEHLFFQ